MILLLQVEDGVPVPINIKKVIDELILLHNLSSRMSKNAETIVKCKCDSKYRSHVNQLLDEMILAGR